VAWAVGVVVPPSARLGLALGVAPPADVVGTGMFDGSGAAGVVAVGVGVGVDVGGAVGNALDDALGVGAKSRPRGAWAGSGRVPAGPTGTVC
jgi:hypothetical protein